MWDFTVLSLVRPDLYNVAAVGDGQGSLTGAVTMKKMFLTDKGKGWAGVTIRDPELLRMTQRLVKTLKWRGPCEIEVIRERGSGRYFLLEINPRFPSWVYLCAGAGMNLPYATALLASGVKVSPLRSFRVGTLFVRIALEQIAHISDLEQITSSGELIHDLSVEHLLYGGVKAG